LKEAPGIEIPTKDAKLPNHQKFREDQFWINFDIIDVQERMEQSINNRVIFDSSWTSWPQATLYFLRLTEFIALILAPIGNFGTFPAFERVGIIGNWNQAKWKWFSDGQERTELILL
jgi:hypothetical protein